jgi:hypothetical protein
MAGPEVKARRAATRAATLARKKALAPEEEKKERRSHSEAMKAAWARPEAEARRIAMKERMADPEVRARAVAARKATLARKKAQKLAASVTPADEARGMRIEIRGQRVETRERRFRGCAPWESRLGLVPICFAARGPRNSDLGPHKLDNDLPRPYIWK